MTLALIVFAQFTFHTRARAEANTTPAVLGDTSLSTFRAKITHTMHRGEDPLGPIFVFNGQNVY